MPFTRPRLRSSPRSCCRHYCRCVSSLFFSPLDAHTLTNFSRLSFADGQFITHSS
ncbi:hypothetical protein CABS01_09194 [Colletotrichum abscissum]|uniref:Uncharacterized protein n=2 Tax=Colletotrichum acutatum species complex TaxID=2707335 RepID=A0AAI9Z6C4_9PEZI|nr:uncharacterized protein CCOS01_01676 [Colletotrichum costaricense]XP_060378713.1 uncharacterized protein CTAM01_10603 [Colletotrichum tamarilloi]XP_060400832.1 uncharacterized protein CABS01_09194 [Colletotrichum abscissum]KAI3531540.1 hypothetical protein CSPX01_14113 [Colletotrichum filicis]KAK1490677.1 hypothetical protein CTAM01_10603 [Colletotrichum tamarilloi]KAK1503805.1 hypothetical protein CABS01_09194 [Colletotrichum abscissum]KAK1536356.1 hypothetical protein CCOS01_01676 [Colle